MVWLLMAFASATMLGFYDVNKKLSLRDNAVLPVLFLNILFCCAFLIPMIGISTYAPHILQDTPFYVAPITWQQHLLIFIKSLIVLGAWIGGYIALKHLPLTVVGPITSTRPVLVLVGALLFFGETLNIYQWVGVIVTVIAIYMMGLSGAREGIHFRNNRWVWMLGISAVLGAVSALFDKYLMSSLDDKIPPLAVLSWYMTYQLIEMGLMLLVLWYPQHKKTTPFQWRWSIPLISLFIILADFIYFTALSQDGAMISVVSMVRRSSVLVSFTLGIFLLREKNIKRKAFALSLILLGMIFLYIGTQYGR